MSQPHRLAGALAATLLAACASAPQHDLLFVDGRGVAPAGDTLLALTRPNVPALLVLDRRTGIVDTIGRGELASPLHVEYHGGRWYVSDLRDGRPVVTVLNSAGTLERRIPLAPTPATPHQFAVLPDGRIVIQVAGGELVALRGDSVLPFAVGDQSERPGLLLGAQGGVVLAAPGQAVTLFNANGNIRWRLEWPWNERAYVSDMALDAQGRLHLLAGEEGTNQFVVFTLSYVTGEVMRWSVPGPYATFSVRRLGEIRPDTAGHWLGERP